MLVKDYQLDPITRHLLHADFYTVAMDKVLRVTVPVSGLARTDRDGLAEAGASLPLEDWL